MSPQRNDMVLGALMHNTSKMFDFAAGFPFVINQELKCRPQDFHNSE